MQGTLAADRCSPAGIGIGQRPGIAPASAPAFIAAQLAGGAIGTLLAVIVYPARPSQARAGQPAQLAGQLRKDTLHG